MLIDLMYLYYVSFFAIKISFSYAYATLNKIFFFFSILGIFPYFLKNYYDEVRV